VEARALAQAYGQHLNQIFTHEMKPLEVEILVAEVGYQPGNDQLFHILYDGTVVDEQGFSVLGGDAETIVDRLKGRFMEGMTRAPALQAAVDSLGGPERKLAAAELEAAVLSRDNGRRAFRRLDQSDLTEVLGGG